MAGHFVKRCSFKIPHHLVDSAMGDILDMVRQIYGIRIAQHINGEPRPNSYRVGETEEENTTIYLMLRMEGKNSLDECLAFIKARPEVTNFKTHPFVFPDIARSTDFLGNVVKPVGENHGHSCQ